MARMTKEQRESAREVADLRAMPGIVLLDEIGLTSHQLHDRMTGAGIHHPRAEGQYAPIWDRLCRSKRNAR